ncbi:MAG: DUF4129 domain-containing protein [Proteobacteria bacterium]|nr:DUF4129 domain-containing protein [Pseudomonadota bacterium]
MKHHHAYLLRLSLAGMEFCWAYAWMMFFSQGLTTRLFPISACVTAFFCSTLLTSYLTKNRFRIIYVILLHAMGFIIVTRCLIHLLQSEFDLFYIKNLLTRHFNIADLSLQPVAIFFISTLLFAGISLFWIQGALFAGRSISSDQVISRFDSGIRSFFYLIFVNTLIIRLANPIADLFLFPFVIFGLLATAFSRNEIEETRVYMNGYQGAGVIIGFSVVTVFLGTGMVMLFIPYLKHAAATGYAMLKWLIVPVVGWVLQIFPSFSPTYQLPKSNNNMAWQQQGPLQMSAQGFMEWIFRGLVVSIGLIVLTALCIVAFHLLKNLLSWLLSRTDAGTPAFQHGNLLYRMFAWFEKIWSFLRKKLFQAIRRDDSVAQTYDRFLSWGRRSGFHIFPAETPAAYGSRLIDQFPGLGKEINLIIDMFNREVYGGINHQKQDIRRTRMALKRLGRFRFWPLRIRSKLKGGNNPAALHMHPRPVAFLSEGLRKDRQEK